MAISLTIATDLCGQILLATRAGYGNWSSKVDPLYPQAEIQDALFAADKAVVAAIIETKGHPYRRTYIQDLILTDGQLVTDPLEGDIYIDGAPGTKMSPGTVARMKYNPNANVKTDGYYCWLGDNRDRISFTGSSCKTSVCKFTPSSSLQAPDAYLWADVCGALAIVFPAEGTKVAAAGHFGTLFTGMLQMIRSGVTEITQPQSMVS